MFARSLKTIAVVVLVGIAGCSRPQPSPTRKPSPAVLGARTMGATVMHSTAPEVAQKLGVTFDKELLLVGINRPASPVVKGKPAVMATVWKCLAKPTRDWVIWTHIYNRDWPSKQLNADHPPATPTTKWQPGKYYVDRFAFVIPQDFKGGIYYAFIGVHLQPVGRQRAANWFPPETLAPESQRLGLLSVAFSHGEKPLAMRGENKEPAVADKLLVTFGKEILLVGCKVQPSPVQKGKPATLEIVWKCLARPSREWIAFTHIDYPGTPAKTISKDHTMLLPIALWEPGKYYRDKVDFTIPASEKPGKYSIYIGLFTVAGQGMPNNYAPEKVMQGGKRYGSIEVAFSSGK